MIAAIDRVLLEQRGHLFAWSPVCLAFGIGWYFLFPVEPDAMIYGGFIVVGGIAGGAARRWPSGWSAVGWAVCLLTAGFCLAGFRAHDIAAPVLSWRYYGPVEGRVVGLDRSASDAVRVTLDRVVMRNMRSGSTPDRVRISLHGAAANLQPGQRIMTTGHLSPPQGPAEPGGFDFRRYAWFKGLGAVGYTRNPVMTVAPPAGGLAGLRVFSVRMATSARIQQILSGDIGGFAAAVTTGDRSGFGQDALRALRASNLAHLLAISGLHMGLLAGFVFAVLRIALVLIPSVGLRIPVKKIAAVGALIAAAGYLMLSGGNVATERAFVMVAVVLCAVLVDRRAFSLRAVAMAALVVLTLRPEALMGPGFQMSFAATTALVAVFGALRDYEINLGPAWLKPVLAVVISSAVAGAATAPIGAAHFNTLSQYGLIANLLSVPLMGVLVIPAAVIAVFLAPFGLEFIGLEVMGWGLRWILGVAHWVASIDGAQRHVASPGPWVLPVLAMGMLWLMLWRGRVRLVGLLPVMVAFSLWVGIERPTVLISDTGGLVGVLTDSGRALSKPKGNGFVARVWLENDGDAVGQSQAALRWPESDALKTKAKVRIITTSFRKIIHLTGKRAAAQFQKCQAGQLVISSVELALRGPCEVYDPKRLRQTGSLAIQDGKIITAKSLSGQRLWNTRPPRHRTYASNAP